MIAVTIVALQLVTTSAQAPPQADLVAQVRETVAAAQRAVAAYTAAGGKAGAPDHPAITWEAKIWAHRDSHPGTDAAVVATTEAVRLLVRAELWDRAHARIDSVGVDDRSWVRLASVVYDEGIARKDLPSTIELLSRLASSTANPSNKAAALIIVGRAYRRQGDKDAATRTLEAAKAAAPGTPYAEEADGLIYEIAHLSIGLRAPAIDAVSRDGRRVTLDGLHGKPVVLVFWGTT